MRRLSRYQNCCRISSPIVVALAAAITRLSYRPYPASISRATRLWLNFRQPTTDLGCQHIHRTRNIDMPRWMSSSILRLKASSSGPYVSCRPSTPIPNDLGPKCFLRHASPPRRVHPYDRHSALKRHPSQVRLGDSVQAVYPTERYERYGFNKLQSAYLLVFILSKWQNHWWYPSDIVAILRNRAKWLRNPETVRPLRKGSSTFVYRDIRADELATSLYSRMGEHTDEDYSACLTNIGYFDLSLGHLSLDDLRRGIYTLCVATEFGNIEAATWLLKVDADPAIHGRLGNQNKAQPLIYMNLGLQAARVLLANCVTSPDCPWQSVVTHWEDQLKPANQAKLFRQPPRVAEAIGTLTRAAAQVEPGTQSDYVHAWTRFANPLKLLLFVLEGATYKQVVVPGITEQSIQDRISSTLLDLALYKDPDAAFELALTKDFGSDDWRALMETAVSPPDGNVPADAHWLFALHHWQHAGCFNLDSTLSDSGRLDSSAFDFAEKALNATQNEPVTFRDRLLASAAMARLMGKYDLGLDILRNAVDRAPNLMSGLRQSDRENRISELRDFLTDYQSSAWNDSLYRERIGSGEGLIAGAIKKAQQSLADRKRRLHSVRI